MPGSLPLTLLLLTLGASDVAREAAPVLTTVVTELRTAGDAEPALADIVRTAIVDTLANDTARTTFGKASLDASLRAHEVTDLSGCVEAPCLQKVAKLMEADTLFTGTVERTGPEVIVTLYELDAVTLRPYGRAAGTAPDSPDALRALTTELTATVVENARGRVLLYGTLEVKSVPPGLVVRVDGTEIGSTPLLKPIVKGTHAVTVGELGRGQVAFDALVAHKKQTVVDVKLREISPPPTAAERAYQSDVVFGPYYYAAKLIVGTTMFALFGAGSLYAAFVTTPFLYYVNEIDLRRIEVWFLLGWGGASLVGAALALVGIALIVWGVVDIFDAPVEPAREPMWHRVIVRAPDGEHTFMYPVDDVVLPQKKAR